MSKKLKDLFINIIMVLLMIFVVIHVALPDIGMKVFGFRTFIVANTGSMRPFLDYPDFIVVVKGDYDNLKVKESDEVRGDYIVFYNENNKPVTHEIIESYESDGKTYYKTKGTNNKFEDFYHTSKTPETGFNTYIGKYAFKVPYLGNIVVFLRSLPGILFLVVSISVITITTHTLKKSRFHEVSQAHDNEDFND